MILDRRTFLGTLAAGALAPRPAAGEIVQGAGRTLDRIGVQLYTLRDLMARDFEGTLAKVAAIGYREVEFAGYHEQTPQQVRTILDRHTLSAPAAHVDYPSLGDKWPQVIEAAAVIGHRYLVNPWIDEKLRGQADDWKRIAETFNRAGALSKKAGIQFAYHNHHFEFVPMSGRMPYDILLTECDRDLVKMEMDLCWMAVAEQDPLVYFQRYPGHFPLVHVKDVRRLPARQPSDKGAIPFDRVMPEMTEVGRGVIDWKRIFAEAPRAGIRHFFVEHDQPADPLGSIDASYKYLASLTY